MTAMAQQNGTVTVRKASERGVADFGWLDSRHSFSFGDYYDPKHMGYRSLRVINDDRIAGGGGFPTHPHRDMEIVTYVLQGALEHKDSMGTGSTIGPGDVQRMSAGTGVTHSEFNHSPTESVHLYQIWIQPEQKRLKPSYEQTTFTVEEKTNRLRLIGSRDARDGSVTIHQDVDLYASVLEKGKSVSMPVRQGRGLWVQVLTGRVRANGVELVAGDAVAIDGASELAVDALDPAEFLVFDLA